MSFYQEERRRGGDIERQEGESERDRMM